MLLNDLNEDYYHLDFNELGKSFYLDHVIDRDVPNFTRPSTTGGYVGDQAKVVKYLYEQRMQFLNDKINALEEQLENKAVRKVRSSLRA